MNAKLILSSALFIGSLVLGALAGPASVTSAQAQPIACWSGYHLDKRGDCQPDIPAADLRCGPGLISQVFPNYFGYICVPIPKGY